MRLSSWLDRLTSALRSPFRTQQSSRRRLPRDVAASLELLEPRVVLFTTATDSTTLTITGISGTDNLTLSTDGTSKVTVSDGATTVDVLLSSFSMAIVVNTLDGDDSLTIDLGSGNFSRAISYDGGSQTTSDSLLLTGGGTFASVTHTFTNASTGTVDVTGNGTVSYTGLEPITDNLSATDRAFTFNGGAETIIVTDGTASDGKTMIDSTQSESVSFANPTGSLTINAGTGDDSITITSVDVAFSRDLTINGGVDSDTVNLNGDITFASGESLIVNAENLNTAASADLTTFGAGAITLTADDVALDATSTLVSASTVTFQPQTASRAIDLGTNAGGQLSLTDIELDRVTAGTLKIGDANSGEITISAALSRAGGVFSLQSGGAVTANAGGSITVSSNDLVVRSDGAITLDQGNSVNNFAATTTSGGITYVESNSGGAININTVDGVGGVSTAGGAISISTTDGSITVSNTISTNDVDANTGTVTLTAGQTATTLRTLTMNNDSVVHGTGGVTLIANGMSIWASGLGTAINAGTNTVELRNEDAGRGIDLGTDIAGQLGLDDAELDRVTAGTVQIGGSNSGTITVSVAITHSNSLSLTTGAGVTLNDSVTMAIDKSLTVGALGATNGTISLPNAASDLFATGTGAISLTTVRNISLASGSSVTTVNGNLTVSANQQVTPNTGFTAIDVNGGLIQSTGTGSVSVLGTSLSTFGIQVRGGGGIIGGTSGTLLVQGAGGGTSGSGFYAVGVTSAGSTITSGGSAVQVVGVENGSGTSVSYGVTVQSGGVLSAGGTGTVSVQGTGGAGTDGFNHGIYVRDSGSAITSAGGNVQLTGQGGGSGASGSNIGVFVQQSGQVSAGGSGTVTVHGTGGVSSGGDNTGVYLIDAGTTVTSSGGAVQITGTGGSGSGSSNAGVRIVTGAQISSGTNGTVTVLGTGGSGGSGSSFGVSVGGSGAMITSGGGNVQVTGQGSGSATSNSGYGVYVVSGAQVTAGSTATVTVQGTGGAGSSSGNRGVYLQGAGSAITSNGGNVSVIGQGGGSGASYSNEGVNLTGAGVILTGPKISASGSGTVTVQGTGGVGSGLGGNYGVYVFNGSSILTNAGNLQVTGQGGGTGTSSVNYGVYVDGGQFSAGGTGTVTVQGTGGATSGNHNRGVEIDDSTSSMTSVNGNVSVTGQGGGSGASGSNYGLSVLGGADIIAGGTGTVTLQGTGGTTTGTSNHGVIINTSGTSVTSGGGNVQVTGIAGGGTGALLDIQVLNTSSITTATNGGDITLIGDSMTISSAVSAYASNTTTLRQRTNGTAINLGATDATGVLGLTDTELDFVSGGTVVIGNANSGELTVSATISRPSATNLQLVTGGNNSLTFSGATASLTNASGSTSVLLNSAGSGSIVSGEATTDLTADSLTLRSGSGGIGVALNPLTFDAANLETDSNDSSDGAQFLSEVNSTSVSNNDLDAGTATITLASGSFQTTSAGGNILSPSVVASGATLSGQGNATTADVQSGGSVAPGNTVGTTGILTTTSATFVSGSSFVVNINGTTVDTEYDRLVVNGAVDLGGATLTLSGTHLAVMGQTFTILENDDTDAITGTFAGLAEGTVIYNFLTLGRNATISYVGGTGNDVVLTVINPGTLSATLDGSGNLTVLDVSGVANHLSVVRSGVDLVIFDSNEQFVTFPSGGVLSNGNKTLTIALSAVTGVLELCGGADDDQFTLDFSGGNVITAGGILFDGQTNGAGGDKLTITGGSTTSVAHAFTNANDGSAFLAGALAGTISYTGLEPITDNLSTTDRSFTFNGGTETITVTDNVTSDGMTRIDSTLGELVDFANPTGSLTINAGTSTDTLTITSLDAGFGAELTLNGDAGTDTVNLNGDITFGAGKSFAVTAETVNTGAGADLVTSGGGTITVTTDNIAIDGTSTFSAGTGTVTIVQQSAARSFRLGLESGTGVRLTDVELDQITAGTLQIGDSATGTVFVNGALSLSNHLSITTGSGVTITESLAMAADKILTVNAVGTIDFNAANADFSALGTGTISLTTARDIKLASGSSVTTVNGDLSLLANQQLTPTAALFAGVSITTGIVQSTGTGNVTVKGRSGTSSGSTGITLVSGGQILGGTSGTLIVEGVGSVPTSGQNGGVSLSSSTSTITSAGANVQVTGTAGSAGASSATGVSITSGQISSGGSGTVAVQGTGGAGTGNNNFGVSVSGATAAITSNNGAVQVTGIGGGSGASSFNYGLQVTSGGQISAGGMASTVTVSGTGGSGTGGGHLGVFVTNADSKITSGGGNVQITGARGSGAGFDDITVNSSGSVTTATNGGSIILIANAMFLSGSVDAGTDTVTLRQRTNNNAINLGAADSSSILGLTDAELNFVTASTINIGDTNSGAITVSTAIAHSTTSNFALTTGGNNSLTFSGAGSLNANGGDVTISLNDTGSGGVVSGTATTDILADDLSITTGLAGIGASGNPLTLSVTTLTTDTNDTTDGAQFLSELNSLTIAASDLDAGTAAITLSGGTFFTSATGSILSAVIVASGATLGGTGTTGAITTQGSGNVEPGNTFGILNSGNITLVGGSNFGIELNGTTVGTQYDQLNITGTVNLGGANLIVTLGDTPANGDSFVIINNDDTDAVTGTLQVGGNTIADGGSFIVSDTTFVIDYTSGSDSNDVTLTVQNPTLTATIVGNDLVIEDIDGTGKNNVLSVSRSGANLVISDVFEHLGTAIAGAALSNGNKTVTIPASALGIGGKIIVKSQGGSDSLSVDVSTDLGFDVDFQGGSGTSDSLTLAADTVTSVTHAFTNANDGLVTIVDGGTRVISYTGLEPITDNLIATDRVFTFNGGAETITLTDATGANMTIDSTLSESVTFANPSGSLTINAGSGDDMITVSSVDTDGPFLASLIVNGDLNTDTLNLDTALTLGSATSAGSVTFNVDNINLNASISTDAGSASGEGGVSLTATGIDLGANVVIDTDRASGTDGSVTVNGPINADSAASNRTLTLTSDGGTILLGNVGSSRNLQTFTVTSAASASLQTVKTRSGGINVSATSITLNANLSTDGLATAGAATLSGAITLGGPVVIDTDSTNDGNISFLTASSTINGTQNFAVVAGGADVSFGGNIGATTALTNISVTSARDATFSGTIRAGYMTQNAGTGTTTFNGTSGAGLTSTLDVTTGIIVLNSAPMAAGDAVTLIASSGVTINTGLSGTVLMLNADSNGDNSGTLTTVAAGSLTSTGAITLTAADMVLAGLITANSGAANVSLRPSTSGRTIGLAGGAGSLGVSDAELDLIDANLLTIGTVSSGTITIGGAVDLTDAPTVNSLTLLSIGSVSQSGGGQITADNLSITAGSAGIGSIGSPLVINVVTLTTDTNDSIDGPQFLSELDSLTISANDLDAGTAVITLSGGTFYTNATGSVLSAVTVADGATLGGTGTVGVITTQSGGTVAPGISPSILNSGDVTFANGSNFNVELNGTAVGSQYDQLNVIGSVTLNDGSLNITLGFTPANADLFTIINNDGSETVLGLGTLKVDGVSIADGGAFYVGATRFVIDYSGGSNNNDVTLLVQNFTTEATLSSGNLVVTDIQSGGQSDTLTIKSDTTNSKFILHDPNRLLGATGIANATGTGTNTLEIPFVSVTGTAITINALIGNDSLTVDFSLGNFGKTLTFNGGTQTTSDSLTLTGGGMFASVTHTLTNANDGSINITDNSPINYTSLEPITDNLSAIDRVFSFNGGNEVISLVDAAGSNTTIDSSQSESVTFVNPTGSLTINAGSGDDTVNAEGVDAAYSASLMINGDDGIDTVNFQTNPTNIVTGGLTVSVENVSVTQAVIANSAMITANAIDISATLTANGGITLQPDDNAGMIGLGSGSGTFSLSETELTNLASTGTVTIGRSTGTGAIDIADSGNGNIDLSSEAFHLMLRGGATSFNAGLTLSSDKTLTLNTGTITSPHSGADVTIAGNGTLSISTSGTIGSATDPLTISVANLDTSSGNNDQSLNTSGSTTIGASGLNAGTGTITLASGRFVASDGTSFDDNSDVVVNGTFDLYGQSETLDALSGSGIVDTAVTGTVTLTVGNNLGSGTFSGVLQNTAGELSLTIAGGELFLTNANTYSGITNVNAGVLDISDDDALGVASAATTVASGAQLNVSASITIAEPLSLAGELDVSVSAASGLSVNWNSDIALVGANATFKPLAGNDLLTINGHISGTALTKSGSGQLTLTAANTYTGATTISDGILSVSGSLPDATDVSIASNSVYDIATSDTIDGLTGSGSITLGTNTLTVGSNNEAAATFSGVISNIGGLTKIGSGKQTLSGANTFTGATTINAGTLSVSGSLSDSTDVSVALNAIYDVATSDVIDALTGAGRVTLGANTLTIGASNEANATFSGVIRDTGSLTKIGSGKQTLSGANTYTGATTINAGTLSVNGSITSSVTVNASGTLAGSGSITGNVTGPGKVAPGNSPGTITINGNYSQSFASDLNLEIGGLTAGTQFDRLVVNGMVTLAGDLNVSLISGFAPTSTNTFKIIDNDGADAVSGTFAGLTEGSLFTVGGTDFRISYVGGSGNDVVLSLPTPDVVLNSVTTDGYTTLTVNYQILNSALASPLGIRFLKSTDTTNNAGDTVLSDVVIKNTSDLTVGSHTVTYTIGATKGSQVQLPGAILTQADTAVDYFLLAAMDATNAVVEIDSDPLNDDNTVVIAGAYVTPKAVYVHGGEMADTVQLSYPSVTTGNITLTINGVLNASYTYPYATTTQFRLRTHGGNDSVSLSNPDNLTMKPMFEFGGDGDDTLVSGHGNDTLNGGNGIDRLVASGNVNFTLTNTRLTGLGTDTLTSLEVAHLTGGGNANNFTVTGWTGTGSFVGGTGTSDSILGNVDTITVSRDVNFTLTNSGLQASDGMTLSLTGISRALLTGGASNNTFNITGWTGTGKLTGGAGSDSLNIMRDANMTLTTKSSTTSLTTDGLGIMSLTTIEVANLTGGTSNNTFTLTNWLGSGTLTGGGGSDKVVVTATAANANFTLSNTQLVISNGFNMSLVNIVTANLIGGTSANSFDVGGWQGIGVVSGGGGKGIDTAIVAADADFTLSTTSATDSSLSLSTGLSMTLSNVKRARLTGLINTHVFVVSGWTPNGTVTKAAGEIMELSR